MDLYVHLVPQKCQKIEAASGYHALFAFEISPCPFTEFRQRAWNPMMAGHLMEAWERQIRLIECLHLPNIESNSSPVFELRLISSATNQTQIDIFFMGKAFAPTPDQARTEAITLAQDVFALFPFDFALRSLSNQTDFERAYQSEWITGLKNPHQIVEIRHFERVASKANNDNTIELLYLNYGWRWNLQSMEQVWCALARYPQRLMLSVSLMPILWDQGDYVYLNELEVVGDKGNLPGNLKTELTSALKFYHQLLYQTPHPFTLRIALIGEPIVPHGLANAIGVGLCLPSLQTENETPGANYNLDWALSPNELSTAKINLIQLSQYYWGTDLVGLPLRRLRYAVSAKQAQAIFRIPIPPEGGFPDVSLGHQRE
ncbi:MAG: hypothetical protein JW953_03385 [Anaerolineae bacterium]|nr:hypothetical protein [Anaerolineae bacterium]